MSKLKYLAAPVLALGALSMTAAPATAHQEDMWSFQTTLNSLNNSGATGSAMVHLHGNEATVTVNVSGADETFLNGPIPHAQHLHIDGQGMCPGPDADTNGDGVIDTPEGQPAYGGIGASLTTTGDTSADSALAVERFPGGSAYTYERTFEVSAESAEAIKNGTAAVVTHGIDPTLLSAAVAADTSPLDPSLALAATLPATCGVLAASQVGAMPGGGADTGVETTAGSSNAGVLAVAGAGVLAVAGSALVARRRTTGAR